jgi:hypothetical protein
MKFGILSVITKFVYNESLVDQNKQTNEAGTGITTT